jgi:signal transduction histidine kinase
MGKVHKDRELSIAVEVPPGLRFRGEKQDFEEMAGNLLDNACKWARSRVRISARRDEKDHRSFLALSFDDDGPGLPATLRQEALSRGRRLDESKPGSGLGLSIVAELARIYGGNLALESSDLGGLSARLRLPAAGEQGSP